MRRRNFKKRENNFQKFAFAVPTSSKIRVSSKKKRSIQIKSTKHKNLLHRKSNNSDNFSYLKIFFIAVFILIFFSVFIKFIIAIENSKFDNNYFNLAVVNKDLYIFNINKDEKVISILEIKDIKDEIKNFPKERMGLYFGVPINAILTYKNSTDFNETKDFTSFNNISSIVFGSSAYRLDGLSRLDLIKIYMASRFISNINSKTESYDFLFNNDKANELVFDLFRDKTIFNDKISIEVINASAIDGVGTKFARMLKDVGFNVISVNSSQETSSSKVIYRIDNNYTIERLKKILNIPFEKQNELAISDVSVIIGKDYASKYADF